MSEWEEKLNTLLSDPDAMAQVMQMAQSLSQQMGQPGGAAPPPPNGAAAPPPSPPPLEGQANASSPLPGGIDPSLVQKLLPLLSQLNRPESGETAAFLRALRPFLKPERQDKVERAAQLARFIHLGKALLLSEGGDARCITAIFATMTVFTPACPCRIFRAEKRRLPHPRQAETHRRPKRRRIARPLRR